MKPVITLLIVFLVGGLVIGYLAAWNDGQYSQNKFNYLTERDKLKYNLDLLKVEKAAEKEKAVIQAVGQLTPGLIVFSLAIIVLSMTAVVIQLLKTRTNQVKTVVIYKTMEPTRPTRSTRQVERLAPGQEPIEVIIPAERTVYHANIQE